ncbi:MAG: Oxaloacetate decarboxylase gamma chain [uncultured Sulfurovum sp.]|uniref:Probable oxaloacetate decarboxylase gamma chain n=1 Tax=uncultured Sulfurovum sp. TaxID=269237 RepID=A0A6S6U3G0_9BACT|nr:MAG: Oxaloacetate decarboxylase gamma chain [uncultured Sulfurovum sp.]
MADEVNYVVEAFKFMLLGMGVVFLFLIILVKVVEIQAKLIAKYFPEDTSKIPAAKAGKIADEEQQKVAAIIAAVTEFRNNKS